MLPRRKVCLRGSLLAGLLALSAGCQGPSTFGTALARFDMGSSERSSGIQTVAATGPQRLQQRLIQPGMEVHWVVNTSKEQPGQVRSGKTLVGPDGTMVVGPYGTCKVAGLTIDGAGAALEKHLAAYMKSPSVRLSAAASEHEVELSWRPTGVAGHSGVIQAAGPQPKEFVVQHTDWVKPAPQAGVVEHKTVSRQSGWVKLNPFRRAPKDEPVIVQTETAPPDTIQPQSSTQQPQTSVQPASTTSAASKRGGWIKLFPSRAQ